MHVSELSLACDALLCWLLVSMWGHAAPPVWRVSRALVSYSKYSYALFLLHVPLSKLIVGHLATPADDLSFAIATAAAVGSSFAAAVLAEESLDGVMRCAGRLAPKP